MPRARGATSAQPLPTANTPVITRHRRFTEPWFRFIRPLLEAVRQNSTDLKAVSEDLTSAQASITTEATVRATNDDALAQSISTVSANLNTNVASLTASITNETTARVNQDGVLAQQISAVTASLNTNVANLNAAVTNEATARAAADSSLASQINTVSASLTTNVSNLNAAVTNEANARAAGDGSLAQSIQSVVTVVDGNSASITQLSSSVDGVRAQWGVQINQSGRVTGLVRLDGGSTGSTFSVLADKFVVVNPTNNGQTIQAFIVGNIAGTPTVGINGNLIVDDTIQARHLDVATLSAISGNIGTVTAGLIQSANGNSFWNLTTGEFQIGG
jgi:hypothetical protein